MPAGLVSQIAMTGFAGAHPEVVGERRLAAGVRVARPQVRPEARGWFRSGSPAHPVGRQQGLPTTSECARFRITGAPRNVVDKRTRELRRRPQGLRRQRRWRGAVPQPNRGRPSRGTTRKIPRLPGMDRVPRLVLGTQPRSGAGLHSRPRTDHSGRRAPWWGVSQFFATPRPIPAVPEGHLKIAQHFSAGSAMREEPSPDRDGRPSLPITRSSLRDLRVESPRTQHSSAGLFSVVPPGRPKPAASLQKTEMRPPGVDPDLPLEFQGSLLTLSP